MADKPRPKPIGTTGPTHLTGGVGSEFIKTEFPIGKDQIEQFVVRGALKSAAETHPGVRALYGESVQNAENNFDFTLKVGDRTEFLELAEIVFPGGHDAASGV